MNGIAAKFIEQTINEFTKSKLKNKEQMNLSFWHIKIYYPYMIIKNKIKKLIKFINSLF